LFVPRPTRGTVKAWSAQEVADLGYEMVLGNTFHLMLAPAASGRRLGGRCTSSWLGPGA
jgi:queuine tRNA-ribosyltransferase